MEGLSKELYFPADINFCLNVLNAYRIKISYLFDKLSSLSNSRTRLLPHQIEVTHRVALAMKPRFILADEVGLGKTIEAGLIMKELIFRRNCNHILIVTPAGLKIQWQQEMKSKFNEDFEFLERNNFHLYKQNGSEKTRLITSLDFIKGDIYRDTVAKREWDLVIFDEAHKLRRDYSKITKAYSFARIISTHCRAMLLLTATPFRGKLEELYYLTGLIDPLLLGPYSSFVQKFVLPKNGSVDLKPLRNNISRILIRRRKTEVGGFSKRFACTIRVELSVEERKLYNETTEYVKRQYNIARGENKRAEGLVMIVFQKLLDSSTRALLDSLERRKNKLELQLHGHFPKRNGNVEEIKQGTRAKIRYEILTLKRLILKGRAIQTDSKLQNLIETIRLLMREGHSKFIIFTQFRSTQEYLIENLDFLKIAQFHGSLTNSEKEDSIEYFREEAEVLISTEAGGEGRNLQFSYILFNYDLPWSPLRIEQRIGRIHRFGQKHDVKIFNFSTTNTVAARVLQILVEKIKLFEESIGPADILLGEVTDEKKFQQSLMDYISGAKTEEEWNQELESMLKIARSGYRKLNELIAPRRIDFNLHDYYSFTKKNRNIDNNEIKRITLAYLRKNNDPLFRLKKSHLENKSDPEYMIIHKDTNTIRKATFRAETAFEHERAEFMAVGHPLVDRALNHFLNHPEKRTIQMVSSGKIPKGHYFIYICHYFNPLFERINHSELISCIVPILSSAQPSIPTEIIFPSEKQSENKKALLRKTDGQIKGMDICDKTKRAEKNGRKLIVKELNIRTKRLNRTVLETLKEDNYKMELNFRERSQLLHEKLDRQRMQYRMNPTRGMRTALTRSERELTELKKERNIQESRNQSEGGTKVSLELLQIYHIV